MLVDKLVEENEYLIQVMESIVDAYHNGGNPEYLIEMLELQVTQAHKRLDDIAWEVILETVEPVGSC